MGMGRDNRGGRDRRDRVSIIIYLITKLDKSG